MPGCTVPTCTNSTKKGFKLYHFPSDEERNSIWAQNCGRESGWKPTKHTCVCEVHFEESQFESHRADGLRKLKPNAVPTIFSSLVPSRSYTRRPKKVLGNELITSSQVSCFKPPLKERKRGRPPGKFGKINNDATADDWAPDKLKCYQRRKRGRPASSAKSQMPLSSPVRKSVKVTTNDRKTSAKETWGELEENEEETVDTPTETTKQPLFTTVNKASSTTSASGASGRDTKRRLNELSEAVKKLHGVNEVLSLHETNMSEYDVFGRYVSIYLQKLPMSQSVLAQNDIQAVLTRYRLAACSSSATFSSMENYKPIDGSPYTTTSSPEHQSLSFEKEESTESRNGEKLQCFVCGKGVDNGISLHTLTNTTKVYMHQKLDKIVMGEMEILIEDDGVLCARCSNLLNYMDRIEVELNMLNKAILNCVKKKYGMGIRTSDKGSDSPLPNIEESNKDHSGELINLDLQSSREETNNQLSEYSRNCLVPPDTSINISDSDTVTVEEKEPSSDPLPQEEIQCRVCRFKTSFKSLMIFHLRLHLKDSYWCDFCNVTLPENATSWVERDAEEESLIEANLNLNDEHAITKVDSEIAQSNGDNETTQENKTADKFTDLYISSENTTNIISNNADSVVSLLPGSENNESTAVLKVLQENTLQREQQKTAKAVEDVGKHNNLRSERNASTESVEKNNSLTNLQSDGGSGRRIRVLNEMGEIVTQEVDSSEVHSSESDKITEDSTTLFSCTDNTVDSNR